MKIIHAASELKPGPRKVCAAIGMFDGVHLGHQQVIRQTIADARQYDALALVITFDAHPSTIVAPQRVPPLIYPLPQKLRTIESLGGDALLLIHFDRPFSEQSGEVFIRGLARELGQIQSLCVGSTFNFGHQRSGNVTLLKKLGAELKFTVHGLAAVSLDGTAISSTRIRKAIREGELDSAGQMLGRPYSIAGRVVRGDQLGRQFGFPTANLELTGLVLPPHGVYVVRASVEGVTYRGVLNIGHRPTLQHHAPQLRAEVHLLDVKANLYGKEMEVAFVDKLRVEKTFPSMEALREQIVRDIAEARLRF